MKSPADVNSESATPMKQECMPTHDWLQAHLDDGSSVMPDAVRDHCRGCSDCSSYVEAGKALQVAILRTPSPQPSPGFAERVVTALHSEPVQPWYRRRWSLAGGFALAASVLIAVLAMMDRREDGAGTRGLVLAAALPVGDAAVARNDVKPVTLRESLQEAESAVGALTRKAADDTFGFRMPKWPMPKAPADPVVNVEPALASLKEVRQNAVTSLTPITESTRRAFGVFWRELGPDSNARN